MRLLEWNQKEDYQPLERGSAFVQFYENNDKYVWWHPFCWNWHFWHHMTCDSPSRREDDEEMMLMGGEL